MFIILNLDILENKLEQPKNVSISGKFGKEFLD